MAKGQCSLCYDIATKYKLPELNYNINKNIKNGKNSCLSLGHMDTIILLVNIKQGVDQEGQQNNNYCLKQNTSVYTTTDGMEARHPDYKQQPFDFPGNLSTPLGPAPTSPYRNSY